MIYIRKEACLPEPVAAQLALPQSGLIVVVKCKSALSQLLFMKKLSDDNNMFSKSIEAIVDDFFGVCCCISLIYSDAYPDGVNNYLYIRVFRDLQETPQLPLKALDLLRLKTLDLFVSGYFAQLFELEQNLTKAEINF